MTRYYFVMESAATLERPADPPELVEATSQGDALKRWAKARAHAMPAKAGEAIKFMRAGGLVVDAPSDPEPAEEAPAAEPVRQEESMFDSLPAFLKEQAT